MRERPIDYLDLSSRHDEAIGQHNLLGIAKEEIQEMSRTHGRIIDLGELNSGSDPNLWVGKTSLKQRVESGAITQPQVEAAFAILPDHFVPATKGAPKRCVEDRSEEGYDDNDPNKYGEPVGPQVQGGTVDEAVALRLVKGVQPAATIIDDIKEVVETEASDYAPGAHTGSHAEDGKKTDCGSVDNEPEKLNLYNDPLASPVIKDKMKAIYSLTGKELKNTTFEHLQVSASELSAVQATYFADLPGVLSTVAELNPRGVKKVVGNHGAASLTLNFVSQSTFHSNSYNAATNQEINNFNLDVWNIFEEHNEQEAANLIAAALATVMRITDGSLILKARLSSDDAAGSEPVLASIE